MLSPLVLGEPGSWATAVQWNAPDRHDPPRMIGSRLSPVASSVRRSAHHSHTLPSVSYRPHAFGGNLPTDCRPRPFDSFFGLGVYVTLNHENFACSLSVSPKYRAVAVPARVTHSHWASVGSAYARPAFFYSSCDESHTQNAFASSQPTIAAGRSSSLNSSSAPRPCAPP